MNYNLYNNNNPKIHKLYSGYMAPEYAFEGIFSVKSDVFSFGVLVLEILSGQRNRGSYCSESHPYLLGNVSIAMHLFFHLITGRSNKLFFFRLGAYGIKEKL